MKTNVSKNKERRLLLVVIFCENRKCRRWSSQRKLLIGISSERYLGKVPMESSSRPLILRSFLCSLISSNLCEIRV